MKILSIQTGKPQTLHVPDPNAQIKGAQIQGALAKGKRSDGHEAGWESAIYKTPVQGPLYLGKTNLVGDGQGDQKNHGGPDKAVCVYAHEHYAHWQRQYGLAEVPLGAFGENFTTEGLLESEVCIGDTLAIGELAQGESSAVVVQVSQARQPCWKLARRWQIADFVEQVQNAGYTGWYFRVLQEGFVNSGAELRLLERPYPYLTLAEANRVMHHDKQDWDGIAALLACPLLSTSWQNSLRRRINLYAPAAIANRIYGRAPE